MKKILSTLFLSALASGSFAIDVDFTLKNNTEFPVTIQNEGQGLINHSEVPYYYCKTTIEGETFNQWMEGRKYPLPVEPGKVIALGKIQYPWSCSYPFETTFKFNFSRKMEGNKSAEVLDCEFKLKMWSKFSGVMEIDSVERAANSTCNIIVNNKELTPKTQTNTIEIDIPVFAKPLGQIKDIPPCLASANVNLQGMETVRICPKGRVTVRLPDEEGRSSMGVSFLFREPRYLHGSQHAIRTQTNIKNYPNGQSKACVYSGGTCSLYYANPNPDKDLYFPAKGAYITIENEGDGAMELIQLNY